MDPVKEAFGKVKEDIDSLRYQVDSLSEQIKVLKQQLETQQKTPTHQPSQQTNTAQIPTQELNEPNNVPLYSLKSPNIEFSSGNEGVPTNKQTNKQTIQHSGNEGVSLPTTASSSLNRLERVSEILDSLDGLKKDLRRTVKKLTSQEMAVFLSIYRLSEKGLAVDYPLIAQDLSLTETSIRDYVRKIIKK